MMLSTQQKQIMAKENRFEKKKRERGGGRGRRGGGGGGGGGGGVGWTASLGFGDANCYIWNGSAMGPYCTAQGTVCDWVNLLCNRN